VLLKAERAAGAGAVPTRSGEVELRPDKRAANNRTATAAPHDLRHLATVNEEVRVDPGVYPHPVDEEV
jgi:hypothetical protein